MIASALPTNGSATKTPSRTRSAATISRLRESRSTSGPASEPDDHRRQERDDEERAHPPRRVRAVRDVGGERDRRHPRADRRSRASRGRAGGSCGAVRSSLIWRLSGGVQRRSGRLQHPCERDREVVELVGRADGDADRRRSTRSRPADARSRPRAAAARRARSRRRRCRRRGSSRRTGPAPRPCSRSRDREPGEPLGVDRAPARKLGVLADARERSDLRRRGHVERAAHLRHRGADARRRDGVADAQAGEAVDLREGAQDGDLPARLQIALDGVRIVGLGRCTRSTPGRRPSARAPARARSSASSSSVVFIVPVGLFGWQM